MGLSQNTERTKGKGQRNPSTHLVLNSSLKAQNPRSCIAVHRFNGFLRVQQMLFRSGFLRLQQMLFRGFELQQAVFTHRRKPVRQFASCAMNVVQFFLPHTAFTHCRTPAGRFLTGAKEDVEERYTELWSASDVPGKMEDSLQNVFLRFIYSVAKLMASIDGIIEGKRRSLLTQTTTMGSSCYSLSSSTSSDVSRVTITYERMKAAAPKNNTKPNAATVPEVPSTAVTIREHLKSPIKAQRDRLIALASALKQAEQRGGEATLKAGIMSVESSIHSLDGLLALPPPSADAPEEKEVLEARITYQLISQLSILYVVLELANEHYHVHPVEFRSARHLFKGEAEDMTVDEILTMPVDLLCAQAERNREADDQCGSLDRDWPSGEFASYHDALNGQNCKTRLRVGPAGAQRNREKGAQSPVLENILRKEMAEKRAKMRKGKKKNKHKKGEEVIAKAVVENEDQVAPPTLNTGLTAAEREVSETLALITPTTEETLSLGFDEDEEEVGVRVLEASPKWWPITIRQCRTETPVPRLAATPRPVDGLAQRSSVRCETPPGSRTPTPPSSPEPLHSFYHHLDMYKARRRPGRRVD
ncbi:hypothetical protein C8R43DRAFT_961653 [Mycena crocata]|nr:hypothetical protein C8R43DRAFT_961653 [Mycena crocata]